MSYPVTPAKRKVFISFHHKDEAYRNRFNELWGDQFIGVDVKLGDIPAETSTDYIKRLIQEEHIFNSSVVFALYGAETYKRKHVDWEISAGLSEKVGGRKGLVVMILPGFPISATNEYGAHDASRLNAGFHPRTAANIRSGYAELCYWPGMYPGLGSVTIRDLVERAAKKRETHSNLIDNSHDQYANNLA